MHVVPRKKFFKVHLITQTSLQNFHKINIAGYLHVITKSSVKTIFINFKFVGKIRLKLYTSRYQHHDTSEIFQYN